MIKRILISSALFIIAMSSAFAAMQVPEGWYVEGNVGTSRISNVNYGATTKSNSGMAWGANLGYKFMPFFSSEIDLIKYSNEKIKNGPGQKVAKATIYSADLAGKGIWPIVPGFELFAKLGIGYIRSQVKITSPAAAAGLGIPNGTATKAGAFLGVGADYSYTPNFPIIVQWSRVIGDRSTGNADFYSIGLGYIFG